MNPGLLGAIALGGALGSVARYVTATLVVQATGTGFPWGTLTVNVIGGFLIGVIAELIASRWSVPPELRGFLITGILGGFTTFSAFSLEMVGMIERHSFASAAAYVIGSVVLSLGATFIGLWAVRGLT